MSSRKRRRSRAVLIDWFTVAAQALNFIILVWLMHRVLYKPIMAAIDARETLVAAELRDAAAKMVLADQTAQEYKGKNEEFERERAALLAKATDEAKAQASRVLEAARTSADALHNKRRDDLEREVQEFGQAAGRRAQKAFFILARRALKDLAKSSLEERVICVFCEQLRAMTKDNKAKLSAAIVACSEPISIRSAFALPSELQNTLQSAVNETFGRQIALRFEIAPDLVGGIEMTAQGQRVGWSIAEYLVALERDITAEFPLAAPPPTISTPSAGTTAPQASALLTAD